MQKLIFNIYIIFFLFSSSVYSQVFLVNYDSSSSKNLFKVDFNNNLNSANLNARLNYKSNIKKVNFYLHNDFNSSVTKLTRNFSRDLNNLELKSWYDISNKISAGLGIQNNNLSDDRDVELNKNSSSFFYFNLDYTPETFAKISSKIGFRTDDQIGKYNQGAGITLVSTIDRLNYQDYIINSKLSLGYEELEEKKNHAYEASGFISKNFSGKADNVGFFKFFNMKNDFFIPSSQSIFNTYNDKYNIQSRSENYLYLQDYLKYYFSNQISITGGALFAIKNYTNEYKYKPVGNSVLFENIYDTKVNENRIEVSGKGEINLKNFLADLTILFIERSENHDLINYESFQQQQIRELQKIEDNKDYSSTIAAIITGITYKLNNKNSFKLSGSSTILRYNTAGLENYDDRDELYFIGSVSHLFSNLENFNIESSFEFNSVTYNYIFRERSANNNNNKIYKLTTKSFYKPFKILTTTNAFQVLANYTVYKFEDLLSQVQSFVFRQLNIWDSTRFDISDKFYINFFGDLKLYEQGQYNDENFSIRPVTDFSEQRYAGQLNYCIYENLIIGTGYRYFVQRQYNYIAGERLLQRTYENFGPYARLTYLFRNNSRIEALGGIDTFISSDNSFRNTSNNLQIKVIWNI